MHFAGGYIVEGGGGAGDMQGGVDPFGGMGGVLFGRCKGIGLGADGLTDLVGEDLDVAGGFVPEGGVDGAAVGVTEDDDELTAQVVDGVFYARQNRVGRHVARDADHEQIADAGGKDSFGDHTGVGTGQDDGVRVLPRHGLLPTGRRNVAEVFAGREVGRVAGDEFLDQSLHKCLRGMFSPFRTK